MLESERLILAPYIHEDLDKIKLLHKNAEVSRMLERAFSDEDIEKRLNRYIYLYNKIGISMCFVHLKITGEYIGQSGIVEFYNPDQDRLPSSFDQKAKCYELTYAFLDNFWGKGYATEAGKSVIAHAKQALPKHSEIVAVTSLNNKISQSVLYKTGFEFVDIINSRLFGEQNFYILNISTSQNHL